jgi:hypothetical protein
MAGRWGLICSLLVVATAACGGDDDDGASPTTTATTEAPTTTTTLDPFAGKAAAALLLAPADLGPEWVMGTVTPTDCGDGPIDDRFGEPLDFAEVSLGTDELGLVESVAFHPDAEAAQAALEEWEAIVGSCERRGTTDGIDFTVAMVPTDLGPYGDDSWTSGLAVQAAGETIPGNEFVIRQGRLLITMSVIGLPDTPTDQAANDLITKALAKSMAATP